MHKHCFIFNTTLFFGVPAGRMMKNRGTIGFRQLSLRMMFALLNASAQRYGGVVVDGSSRDRPIDESAGACGFRGVADCGRCQWMLIFDHGCFADCVRRSVSTQHS